MNHPDTHDHAAHTTSDTPYFPPSQWEQFRKEDITAGGAIVVLMGSIFTVGLILYFIVAMSVRAVPMYQA
jgi:hypothetical protein